ncbi:hypothetical protein CFC21_106122 [Triticum aestivum]|uniref:GCK domain-containing protein n=2 Tax=Triticum aestivum TaxID=4565 RepID=A0A9R1N971_WHEAT|nr:hypothetical protein CFC21_106122 [Triticum aestivum]
MGKKRDGLMADLVQATVLDATRKSEAFCVTHHVANGGCIKDFLRAMGECHPELGDGEDVGECINATAALRRCFADNPAMSKHIYLNRMDEGLDEDRKLSPEQVKEESNMFRWWTGMRRT